MRARRRRARVRLSALLLILALVLIAAFFWLVRQPYVRVESITVYGADSSLAAYAHAEMFGSYFGLVPRDSIIFLPEAAIRRDILAAHPEIAAVSIFRESFTSISLKALERVPIARWCGATFDESASSTPSCYFFDGNGYVFEFPSASSSPVLNSFAVYDAFIAPSASSIGATLANADQLPAAFAFARSLADFGSPIWAVVIRGDEVDDYMQAGPRITYVLGQEQQAYDALDSAAGDLNFTNGSIDYVDLRFPGDVYVKKSGAQ